MFSGIARMISVVHLHVQMRPSKFLDLYVGKTLRSRQGKVYSLRLMQVNEVPESIQICHIALFLHPKKGCTQYILNNAKHILE